MGRVLANGPGDLDSIPGYVILKTLKIVLDTSLLNTQQYKVRIKGKVEQSKERSSTLPLHLRVVAIEKGPSGYPRQRLPTLLTYTGPLAEQLECSPKARQIGVQSQVKSYQRLKKWFLMLPCLTLSIIRYGSRVKWGNPRKRVRPSWHLSVLAIEKGAFGSPSTMIDYVCLCHWNLWQ